MVHRSFTRRWKPDTTYWKGSLRNERGNRIEPVLRRIRGHSGRAATSVLALYLAVVTLGALRVCWIGHTHNGLAAPDCPMHHDVPAGPGGARSKEGLDGSRMGGDMRGANLVSALLYGADMRGANLFCANLRGADMRDADLRDVGLYNADLSRADLTGAATAIAQRLDGYMFLLIGDIVHAGCRRMTIADYRQHVAENYPGTPKAAETLRILDYLSAAAHAANHENDTP